MPKRVDPNILHRNYTKTKGGYFPKFGRLSWRTCIECDKNFHANGNHKRCLQCHRIYKEKDINLVN
jgi:hypothetical protein